MGFYPIYPYLQNPLFFKLEGMDFMISLFWPGYLHWKEGEKEKSFLWLLPVLLFIGYFIFKLANPTVKNDVVLSGFEVFGSFMEINTLRALLCLGMLFLSGLMAYFDFTLQSGTENASSAVTENADHESWEKILGCYLRSEDSEAIELVEKQLKLNKKDPFTHYMNARLLIEKGERQKALKALKKCVKFDKKRTLSHECKVLIRLKKLEN
jgi:tetratricopeptide (TPR) repeat protein